MDLHRLSRHYTDVYYRMDEIDAQLYDDSCDEVVLACIANQSSGWDYCAMVFKYLKYENKYVLYIGNSVYDISPNECCCIKRAFSKNLYICCGFLFQVTTKHRTGQLIEDLYNNNGSLPFIDKWLNPGFK